MKKAKLTQEQIENYPSLGTIIATKQVMDQDMRPQFILRDKPNNQADSGWVIFSGLESDEDSENVDNFGIYDVKTLLNMYPDPKLADILIYKGIGSVLEYDEEREEWSDVDDYELENDYMCTHRLTEKWVLDINNLFIRNIEEGGDLLYTTGDKSVRMTIWVDDKSSSEDILARYKDKVENRDQSRSKTIEAFDLSDKEVFRFGYQIKEKDDGKEYDVIYTFTINKKSVLMAVFYFDDPEDKDWALKTWESIRLIDMNECI